MGAKQPLLRLDGLTAGYGAVPVVHDISIVAHEGELLTVLGGNGAGKSTLLQAISGIVTKMSGSVTFDGEDITGMPAHEIVSLGLVHVAEGHRIFREMTVAENLAVALWRPRVERSQEEERRSEVFDLFPILAERRESPAAVLSGGEQQMLAIAQALMKQPRLLMLDEPSLGLAPRLIDMVFEVIGRLRATGITIVLVEQVVERALDVADAACLIRHGRLVAQGSPEELRAGDEVRRAYMGAAGGA